VLDGVPLHQPALALAAKLIARARRAGMPTYVEAPDGPDGVSGPDAEEVIGERLWAVVAESVAVGVDPESALRRAAGRFRDTVRALEARAEPGGSGQEKGPSQ
jgi:XTP/dITP diphosphohydrolase